MLREIEKGIPVHYVLPENKIPLFYIVLHSRTKGKRLETIKNCAKRRIVPKRLFRRAALYRQNIQKPSTKNNAIRHSKQGFVVDIPHAMRYNKVNSIQINIIPFSKT